MTNTENKLIIEKAKKTIREKGLVPEDLGWNKIKVGTESEEIDENNRYFNQQIESINGTTKQKGFKGLIKKIILKLIRPILRPYFTTQIDFYKKEQEILDILEPEISENKSEDKQ